jgi:hypothetical protein
VLHDTYGHVPVYCGTRQQGVLSTLLPLMEVNSPLTGRRGVSLPFTDECLPLGFSEGMFQKLLQEVIAHGRERRWKCVECRGGRAIAGPVPVSTRYLGHVLTLDSDERSLLARFEGAVRRAIRKAENSGVRVEISQSPDAMRTYYDLHCLTRKKHGLPPQPWNFFANIDRHLVSKGSGFVSLARHEGTAIAGAVFFVFGRVGVFKFGASRCRDQHLRGNNLVMWEAIRWLSRRGCELLDFGRTSPSNEGLRRFKLGWRTTERAIEYFEYDFQRAAYVAGQGAERERRWFNAIFRHAPIRFSRLAGLLLYRHQS